MKILTSVLVLVILLGSGLSVSAKRKDKKLNDKAAKHANKAIGSAAHPVFGDGRLHPVHDDKVIGKFKNADKVKAKVNEIDDLDDDTLSDELEEIAQEKSEQKTKLTTLKMH